MRPISMDKHTILIVVVTGVITATVTQLVNFILSASKDIVRRESTKKRIKGVFSKTTLSWAWDIFLWGVSAVALISALHRSGPPTRGDVFEIVIWTLVAIFWTLVLLGRVIFAQGRRRSQNATNSAEQG